MTSSEQRRADAMADLRRTERETEEDWGVWAKVRQCAYCKGTVFTMHLIKFSVRRYAHATCLLAVKGWPAIFALPEYPQDCAIRSITHAAFRAVPGLRGDR
jgi:hypothetical protein